MYRSYSEEDRGEGVNVQATYNGRMEMICRIKVMKGLIHGHCRDRGS